MCEFKTLCMNHIFHIILFIIIFFLNEHHVIDPKRNDNKCLRSALGVNLLHVHNYFTKLEMDMFYTLNSTFYNS